MRTKKQILEDGKRTELLMLEVLVDIRDLLKKKAKAEPKPRRKYKLNKNKGGKI